MKVKLNCNGTEHEAEIIDHVIYSECPICNGMLDGDIMPLEEAEE